MGKASKAGRIGGFFKNHGRTLVDALALAEGVHQNRRQNKIGDRYRALAEAEYARRTPLRERGMQLLLDDSVPDTSDLRDPLDPAVPGRYRRVNIGGVV